MILRVDDTATWRAENKNPGVEALTQYILQDYSIKIRAWVLLYNSTQPILILFLLLTKLHSIKE
jgi:hypothetical protein